MAFNPTTPLTGATVAGLTSPTYTLSVDTPPTPNGKQYAITALGGTQTSVTTTSAASPFTLSFFKPSVLKQKVVDSLGRTMQAPMNVYKVITRKGVVLDTLNTPRLCLITTTIEVPAGAEVYDVNNVKAALSCHIGALSDQSSGISVTTYTGVL